MKNSKYFTIGLLLIPNITWSQETSKTETNPMFGNWARSDGVARVNVNRCGENYCATNIWIKPNWKTEKVGDVLVMKITTKGKGVYNGTAFDKQRNMSYKFHLQVNGDSMHTKGCVLGGLLCKSVGWTRL